MTQDYLTAPMPFLIGLQSSMLPMLKHLPMDEVTLIDLELGTCEPASGSPQDAARLLPWPDRLHAALQVPLHPFVHCITHSALYETMTCAMLVVLSVCCPG